MDTIPTPLARPMPGRRLVLRAAMPFAGLFALAACASPDTTFFTLSEVPGTPIAALSPTAPHVVEERRPGLPGYLDRTDIVCSQHPRAGCLVPCDDLRARMAERIAPPGLRDGQARLNGVDEPGARRGRAAVMRQRDDRRT